MIGFLIVTGLALSAYGFARYRSAKNAKSVEVQRIFQR